MEFLINSKVDVKKLTARVLPLNQPVMAMDTKLSSKENVQEKLQNSKSIEEIFELLASFWSFIDFYILEDIILKVVVPISIGTTKKLDQDQSDNVQPDNVAINEMLRQYKRSVIDFLDSWKVNSRKTARVDEDNQGQEMVYIKMDTDEMSMYLHVKSAIRKILNLKSLNDLTLVSVEPGCIKLVFRCLDITVFAALRLPTSRENYDQLKQIIPRILKITTVDFYGSDSVVFQV